MPYRKFSRRIHLWLGIPLSLLLFVISLSGVLLVYYVEIDDFLIIDSPDNNHLQAQNWDAALTTLRQRYPDKTGPWRFDASAKKPYIYARYYNAAETKDRVNFSPVLVWLTLDGSEVIHKTIWGDTPMTWLYNLHSQLLSGDLGYALIGYIGLAGTLMLVSGLVVWFPKKGQAKKAFSFKARKHIVGQLYDWHKTLGYSCFLPVLVITVTGVMMALPKESNYLLEQVTGEVTKPEKNYVTVNSVGIKQEISLNTAIDNAKKYLGSSELAWIQTSSKDNKIYRLRFKVDSDPSVRFPHSHVEINSTNGELISLFDIRQQSSSNIINNWLHPLHDGSLFGHYTRVTWLLLGLMMTVLTVLGFYRWLYRVKLRKIKAHVN